MHIYRKKKRSKNVAMKTMHTHTHTVDCQPNGQPKTIEKRRWSHIERWKAKAKQNKNLQGKTSIVQRKRWTSWTCTFEFCIFAYARFACNVLVCCILCLKKTRWIIPDGVYFSQACTIHRCLLEGVLFSIFLLLLYFCYIFFFDRMFCSWSLIICTNKQKKKMERTRESKKTQLNHTQCTLIGTKLRFKQSKQVNELWTRILFWYFILFVSINWPQQHCKTPLFLDVLFYFDFYELKSENK